MFSTLSLSRLRLAGSAAALGVACAFSSACDGPPKVTLIQVETPMGGPASVPGSGGTGAAGSFGTGGTFGGTSWEGAHEVTGGPAGRATPRYEPAHAIIPR